MIRRIFSLALVAGMTVFAAPCLADTFVWKDDVHGFTASFPDSWRVQTVDGPNTRLRIAGPLGEDFPTCRVQVQQDGRRQIYPKRLVDEMVFNTLNKDYWEWEVGQYDNPAITDYYAPASLGGKGDATAVQVSYQLSLEDGKKLDMHGVMIASIYNKDRYVASCSARAETYARWAPVFMSILDSVELKSKYHPFATGYYRNFLMDPKLALPRVKPGTITPKNTFWFKESKYNE